MTQDLSTWQEVALIAGPAIAAFAALASWASVLQARKMARESSAPHLMAQKVIDKQARTIGAVVTNAGGGAARGASVFITHPPFWTQATLGHGFLFPGEARYVQMQTPATDQETHVVAFCRDRDSFPHYWSASEQHIVGKTRFRRRPRHDGDVTITFRKMHPDVDFDDLTQVESTVTIPP